MTALRLVAVTAIALAAPARADDRPITTFDPKIVPSGVVKAYTGPEGELVVMLEINAGRQMLVHFKNFGGALEGTTRRYLLDDLGHGKKDVYLQWKRGSKTYRRFVASARNGRWELYPPDKPSAQIELRFAEAASAKFTYEDLVKTLKP